MLQVVAAGLGWDLGPLAAAAEAAEAAGGLVFELVVGAPAARYGARLTLRPAQAAGRAELAAAVGLAGHPWGEPDWVGLRQGADGVVRVKGYHRVERVPPAAVPNLPEGAPDGLESVMAASAWTREEEELGREAGVELYLRLAHAAPWSGFARRTAALLGAGPPAVRPAPRPAERGFCASFAWTAGRFDRITLYADSRCLAGDERVAAAWEEGLEGVDLAAYRAGLAAVRSLGRRPPGGWHAMLAWAVDGSGEWTRAVSLHLPRRVGADG